MATTWSTVRAIGSPRRVPIASTIADRTAPSDPSSDPDLRRGVADALPTPLDHPELECQEFIEGETSQRRVAARERGREVCLLDGPGDRHELLGLRDLRRQILGIRVAGLVERLAHRGAEPDRGQTGGQRIDRHDAAGVEQLGLAHLPCEDLELRVVERQAATEMLELAGHDDLRPDVEATLDEAATEPGGVDRTRVVLEPRDRALGPAAETRLDTDVTDRRLGRHHVPVGHEDEVAQLAHLAEVVVAPREVEQQVADVVEVELDAGPLERRCGCESRLRERRRQERDRIGRDRWRDRARRLGHAYSAAIRYR